MRSKISYDKFGTNLAKPEKIFYFFIQNLKFYMSATNMNSFMTPNTQNAQGAACGPQAGCGSSRAWCAFLVLAVIVGIILYVARPCWLRRRNGEECREKCEKNECEEGGFGFGGGCVDWGRLIFWSLVISAVLLLIFYCLGCGANWAHMGKY